MEKIIVILEKTKNGGYSAYLPDLPGCVATSSSLGIVKEEIRDAVKFHLEGMMDEGLELPELFRNDYNLEYKLDVKTLFDWFSGILTKSGVSRITGLNQSLINQYALGIKTPSEKQAKKIEKALHSLGHELLEIQLK
jgi:predicted RNase H-like HicB family nuclease